MVMLLRKQKMQEALITAESYLPQDTKEDMSLQVPSPSATQSTFLMQNLCYITQRISKSVSWPQ